MGTTHTIWEDLLEDTSFLLYAIHSNLEDYALAYQLNLKFGLRLRRMPADVELAELAEFPCFQWNDHCNFREWTLFCNRARGPESGSSDGLFPQEPSQRWHALIPEKKSVDYFLKLEGETSVANLLASLREIPKVVTAYELEPSELKSKRNLIL